MNKWLFPALTALAVLSGCSTVPRGSIPVVDSGSGVSNSERVGRQGGYRQYTVQRPAQAQSQSMPSDAESGVTVMVPPSASAAPIQTYSGASSQAPITPGPAYSAPVQSQPYGGSTYNMPQSSAPTGIPSNNSSALSADEQLDGPVLALLSTAQQQQSGGDLNGASSSLERAQRIAPREPQVLYKLAQVRLAQGDAAQAEQLARRGLGMAGQRPDLQAGLWEVVAQARERQGDAAGASLARQKAQGR